MRRADLHGRSAAFLALAGLCAGCRKEIPPDVVTRPEIPHPAPRACRLPRELADPALGLGLTVIEAKIRLPDLRPAASIAFAAPPTYYVCEEIARTHDYLLAQSAQAEAFQSRPRRGGLESLTLYVINNAVLAARGLYDDDAKKTSYLEFVKKGADRYGRPSRAEILHFSDGTRVMFTVWQDARTTVLLGETDAPPPGAVLARYVYLIDGALLAQSFRAMGGRANGLFDKITF